MSSEVGTGLGGADVLRRRGSGRRELGEAAIRGLLLLCALVSVLTTLGIVLVLAREALSFFAEVPWTEFLFGTRWTPLLEPRSYGVLPLVAGTMMIVVGASAIAVPIGLGSAIYLSEYARPQVRALVKPLLEVLAGIPTVVFGFFALTVVTPLLRTLSPEVQVFNAASASIVVGIMILPMITSLCDDSLRAVPQGLREAALAVGATRMDTSLRVVIPAAHSGISASVMLAISRAIGETMAVTLAAGATPRITVNYFESIQTMTAYIVAISLGDAPSGTTEYKTLFAVAGLLFVMTLFMNLLSDRVMRRFREVVR